MMKTTLSLAALAVAISGCTAAPTPTVEADTPASHLYIAAAFTKAQKYSSIPTDAGIFMLSPDQGWIPYGPKIQQVNSATVSAQNTDLVYLSCGNGIVRSTDGGHHWRLVTDWRVSDVYAVAIDPTDNDTVYGASGWGLVRSTDGGDTWTAINDGLDEQFSRTMLLDEVNPTRLLAGTTNGLYLTTNRGDAWNRVDDVPAVNILRLRRGVADPSAWLAGTEGRGAWLSTDDGATWQATAPELATANLYGCAVDPTDSQHLALGGWETGVWTSTDGGTTWTDRSAGLPSANILTLAYDPGQAGRLWTGCFEEGLFYSDDHGATWQDGKLVGALTNDLGFQPLQAVAR